MAVVGNDCFQLLIDSFVFLKDMREREIRTEREREGAGPSEV